MFKQGMLSGMSDATRYKVINYISMKTSTYIVSGLTAVVVAFGAALPAFAQETALSASAKSVVNALTKVEADINTGADASGSGLEATTQVGLGATSNTAATSSSTEGTSTSSNTSASLDTSLVVVTRADVENRTVVSTSRSPSAVNARADLTGYVAAQLEGDERLSAVETSEEAVAVTYEQYAKLFGFIPVTVEATAEVTAEGKAEVDYAWYGFLLVTSEAELEAKIEAVVQNAVQASAVAQADVTAEAELAANAQARIIEGVRAAMESQLELDVAASVNASGNADL